MSKITLATIKSFIKKNQNGLFIKHLEQKSFTDSLVAIKDDFRKVEVKFNDNDMSFGVPSAHFSRYGSRYQYLTAYSDNNFWGYKICNSVGSFIIAVSLNPSNIISTLTIDTKPESCILLNQKDNYKQILHLFSQYSTQIMEQVEKAFTSANNVIFCSIIDLDGQYYAMFHQFRDPRGNSNWFGCPVTIS